MFPALLLCAPALFSSIVTAIPAPIPQDGVACCPPDDPPAAATTPASATPPPSSTAPPPAASTTAPPSSSSVVSSISSAAPSAAPSYAPWDQAQCTQQEVTDASIDQGKRWASVNTEDAWTAAINAWNANGGNGLTFPQAISNFFHGPEQMLCGDTSARDGCSAYTECTDVNHPGGYFILNSFVSVSDLNYNTFDAIGKAGNAVENDIGAFADTFAPIDDESEALKLCEDLLGLGFALAASPVWNSALKAVPFFKTNPNTLGTLKDEINPMVSNGITISKDTSIPGVTLAAQNTLAQNVVNLVKIWTQTMDTFNSYLFNGSSPSIDLLHSMIANGQVLEAGFEEDVLGTQNAVEKAIYGFLIPQAWPLSNNDLHPVVLDANASCGAVNPIDQYVSTDDGPNNWSCFNGKLYYLMSASGLSISCSDGGDGTATACTDNTFYPLPGVDKLDGKAWGGVTKDDLVASAVNSFNANGNANGWGVLDPTSSDSINNIYDDSIQAAGVVQIPVCTADKAFAGWAAHQQNADYPDNYPCS